MDDAAEAFFEQHILIVRRDLAHGLPPFGIAVNNAGINADVARFGGQPRKKSFLERFALPVRENLFPHKAALLIRHNIRILRTGGEVVHLAVDPLPGKFRRQDAALAVFADGTDNEFALENMHTQVGAAVIKRLRAADAGGLALALFVGLCPKRGALAGDLRFCVYVVLSDLFNACCNHSYTLPFSLKLYENTVTRRIPPRQRT